jgi:hypothetical protein
MGLMPPSPCTGSMITAAVRSRVIARFAATTSPTVTNCTPGISGMNGSCMARRSVTASAPNRRPWNALRIDTISCFAAPPSSRA